MRARNSPGRPLVYAADAAALAVLEVRLRLDLSWDLLPPDFVLLTLDLGSVSIETVSSMPADTVGFGDNWLNGGRSAVVLRVPSIIVPDSSNLLVNPHHADSARVTIADRRSFAFDQRLWSGT